MLKDKDRVEIREHTRDVTPSAVAPWRDELARARVGRAALELLPSAASLVAHDTSEEDRDRAAGKLRPRGGRRGRPITARAGAGAPSRVVKNAPRSVTPREASRSVVASRCCGARR
jgi:hypothetical protein